MLHTVPEKNLLFNLVRLVRCILILSAAIYSHSIVIIRSCVANMNAIINANISASCVFGTAQKVTRSSESYHAIYWSFVLANPQTDQLMASSSLGTIFNFPTRICCGVLHPVGEILHSVCEVCLLFGCMFWPYLNIVGLGGKNSSKFALKLRRFGAIASEQKVPLPLKAAWRMALQLAVTTSRHCF